MIRITRGTIAVSDSPLFSGGGTQPGPKAPVKPKPKPKKK